MTAAPPGLLVEGVSKRFGGVTALSGVDFAAYAGEIHALLGQNGSGKSTLVKIISGVHQPDHADRFELWGEAVRLPLKGLHEHGIAVIHQDLGLVDGMSVAENLAIGAHHGRGVLARIAFSRERQVCREVLAGVGLDVDPDVRVSELSPAARAGVAIARATRLLREQTDRFILVLDEPTAYLAAAEAARVADLMRTVARGGAAVIFISHRLAEVLAHADRITILRDGRVRDSFMAGEGDADRIIPAMLGRRLDRYYPERGTAPNRPATLRVEQLSGRRVRVLSLQAAPGEIIGMTGLEGMGHGEVPYLLAGTRSVTGGRVYLDGAELTHRSIRHRMAAGVVLVPGNRQRDGAWLAASAQENITLPQLALGSPWTRLRLAREREHAVARMLNFAVRPPYPARELGQFSGGNQQKIVLAKWLATQPKLLLLDEPTQGIDAGAKLEILRLIADVAERGAIVVMCSGDFEQLTHMCHRVLVFQHGVVSSAHAGPTLTEAAIARATHEASAFIDVRGQTSSRA